MKEKQCSVVSPRLHEAFASELANNFPGEYQRHENGSVWETARAPESTSDVFCVPRKCSLMGGSSTSLGITGKQEVGRSF
ncbi:hypothetical protein R1flu_002446 [Riccia fluitans]|uniref:Uncharacterized protein n=1 Tax=Riccia fluitans TaxID=41844 RepID=A0ABD1Y686_9MARC